MRFMERYADDHQLGFTKKVRFMLVIGRQSAAGRLLDPSRR
jgi:hypothetical protein